MEADLLTLRGRPYWIGRIGEPASIPPESSKIVVCLERNDKMKVTSPRKESRSPRTREGSPHSLDGLRLLGDTIDQLKEDSGGGEQSDPSIVVRDGRTDHRRCKESVHPPWRREGQEDKASKALTARKVCPRSRCQAPCLQREVEVTMRIGASLPSVRSSEEPCAGKPHAGICEGGVRQLAFLP